MKLQSNHHQGGLGILTRWSRFEHPQEIRQSFDPVNIYIQCDPSLLDIDGLHWWILDMDV